MDNFPCYLNRWKFVVAGYALCIGEELKGEGEERREEAEERVEEREK